MTTWKIESNQNNGYPININFLVGSISDRWQEGEYNLTNWRIKPDFDVSALNTGVLAPIVESPNAYPHIWAATQIIGSGGGGEEGEGDIIDTDSYRSNNITARPGAHDTLTSSKHRFDTNISDLGNAIIANSNVYIMPTSAFLQALLKNVRNYVNSLQGVGLDVLQNLSGSNIFNAFVSCRAYPFSIAPGSQTNILSLIGYDIELNNPQLIIYKCNNSTVQLNFGSIENLGITESWHISECRYQIYLPFIGVTDFQPCNNESLSLIANVDIINGSITYILSETNSGEQLLIASGNIGIDIPINLSQAIKDRNTRGNVIGIVQQAVNNVYKMGKGIQKSMQGAVSNMGGDAGETISALGGASMAATDFLNDTFNQVAELVKPKQSNPCYQVLFSGNDNTIASLDMTPKIFVHKSNVFEYAQGQNTAKGLNQSKYYNTLSDLAGETVQCTNYHCTNIGLTEAEKRDIESKMNAGVIL